MSKTNTVGYIASFPIPEVIMGINAFLLGAHSVNPDIKLKIVWAYTWFDPPKEADAAKVLMDQGADIITQHTDSTAALQAAAERGVLAFGQASEVRALCGQATILRGGKRVDNCVPVEETAQSLAEKMIGRRVEPIQDRETPMSTQKRLVVSNLSKRSDELHGTDIQDVTFTVHAGEILGIAGIAGTSIRLRSESVTFILQITGILPPTI